MSLSIPTRILIRDASPEDSPDIWAWRNDPRTRAMSITPAPVAWDVHRAWYEATLTDPDRRLFLGVLEPPGQVMGICRFDLKSPEGPAEVSINLNPAMRGKGLSIPFLRLAIDRFLAERCIDLVALIKRENEASIQCFSKSGFVLDRDDGGILHFRCRPDSAVGLEEPDVVRSPSRET